MHLRKAGIKNWEKGTLAKENNNSQQERGNNHRSVKRDQGKSPKNKGRNKKKQDLKKEASKQNPPGGDEDREQNKRQSRKGQKSSKVKNNLLVRHEIMPLGDLREGGTAERQDEIQEKMLLKVKKDEVGGGGPN